MPGFGRVLARLFAIQAAWNYERLQGVGFGYAAEPALRALEGGPGGQRYREALARQSQYFNAHPYLAGLAVGAAVRAELEGESAERIARLRQALCGPLGSLGDRLFWASWLPACAAIGIGLVVFGAGLWAVVVFLVLYNVAHVLCRVWALRAGWRHGAMVSLALSSPAMRAASRLAAPLAGVIVGAVIPVAFRWQTVGAPIWALVSAAAGACLIALLLRGGLARAGAAAIAAAVLGATWVVGLLWS
jgi:PTS system mannose-specific IID component